MSDRGDADGTLMIHPGYQFGDVCCGTTRVPAHSVAACVFAGDSVDVISDAYALPRTQILTACWWYATDAARQHRKTAHEKRIVTAWGDWAFEAHMILGGHRPGPCPDPPEVKR